jgi:hypothetical protein
VIFVASQQRQHLMKFGYPRAMGQKKRNPEGLRRSSTKGGGFGGVCPALAPNTRILCAQRVMVSRTIAALQNTFYQSSIKFNYALSGNS